LSLLDESKIDYIVGARLKKSNAAQQEEIFSETGWNDLTPSDGEDKEKYKELAVEKERRVIVTYRTSRARKDKTDRDKTVQKLIKRIEKSKDPVSLISNFGYKKFITVTGDSEISINDTKLEQAARWDGMHGIMSNIKKMSPSDLLSQYRSLWEIEECFRISKHDLKFRPVFHWTPERVKAHIAICFASLLCVRYLQFHLKAQGNRYSVQTIVHELNAIQASVVKDVKTQKRYAIPSRVSEIAHTIYKRFGKNLNQIPYEI
jgi:transposase